MPTTENLWQVREYDAARDAAMVEDWWSHHNDNPFPSDLLPPAGAIIECDGVPYAACWLYMAVGVGVCWLEWPVSAPGLSLRQSREAFTQLVDAMALLARSHNYPLMIANTLPPIARIMKGMGFTVENRTKVTVYRRS
jgi:hypothetical protein